MAKSELPDEDPPECDLEIQYLRRRMCQAADESGLSLAEIGRKMGLKSDYVRQSVWWLLHRTKDPTFCTVLKFCCATGVSIHDLITSSPGADMHTKDYRHLLVNEVASRLTITPGRVRHFIEEGRLRAIKRGRQWFVPLDDLEAFEQLNRPPHRPPGNQRSSDS